MTLHAIETARSRAFRILELVAKAEEPLNKYKIWKSLEHQNLGSEPTIFYTISDLETAELIKVAKIIEKPRGTQPSKLYVLTALGLLNLIHLGRDFREADQLRNLIRKIAGKEGCRLTLPLLALWPSFIEAGVEDEAEARLLMLATYRSRFYRHGYLFEADLMQPVLRAKEKVQEEVFGSTSDTNYFFNPYLLEGSTRWLDALRKHNVIQAAAIPVLFRLIEHSLETATIDLRAIIDVMKAIGIDTYPEDMASQVLVRIDALSNVLRGLASVIEPTISNHSMRKSRD